MSRGHLMKIVGVLASAGILRSQRGRAGGFTLGRSPDEIRLGDVLRLTEPDFEMVECFSATGACAITPFCSLRESSARLLTPSWTSWIATRSPP